ncbi:MAG TPA: cytochrome P450 [Novosphingobium sp.]|nr:cytochrome P450 [Novosphingobium sp.]HPZ46900.1 cytochrome P450 [Novosphingobium sp.]HQD99251.1 cytochrome P450 [Novosphingobium sp.]
MAQTDTAPAAAELLASWQVDEPAPPHVPRERVVDIRFAMGQSPNDLLDPYAGTDKLRAPGVPRLLYSPYPFGDKTVGTWCVSHYEDIRRVYEDNDYFSTKGVAQFQALAGETFPSIPLGIDPPDHARYRRFLNVHFTPVALQKLEPKVRALAVEMIEEFAARGEVDIAHDFGRVYPVRVFLDLMGLPFAMFEQFLAWEYEILHSRDHARMGAAVKQVIAYLREFIAEKQKNPDDKLGSYIANGVIDGQPLTPDEIIGMTWFLWLGGLDTVASTISQMFRRLALDQALQQRLRDEPGLTNTAVEEFLRMQPLVNSFRLVKQDLEWDGVTLKAGDYVTCLNSSGNFDPAQFTNPRDFDPARPVNRHYTFVGGIHLCLGAHLARRELRILIDEFVKRVPAFTVKPGADTTVVPGLLSIRNLPIVWTPAA